MKNGKWGMGNAATIATCAITVLALLPGCASLLAYNRLGDEMLAAKEAQALSVSAIPGGAQISVSVTALDYLVQHPFIALGAAAVDGLTTWGLVELGQWVADSLNNTGGDSDSSEQTSTVTYTGTNGNVTVIQIRDGNQGNVREPEAP
jgi:hypothetical protein